jgi:hypothetical protein
MNGSGRIGARLWRSLLSIAVAYAVAIQSLMIAVGGFSLPPDSTGQNRPTFELCLHDASGAPALPADKPDLSGCTHCIFCFAGAHDALVGAAPADFHRVNVAMLAVPWPGDRPFPVRLTRHTIASPRGPPLSA